MHLNNKKVLVLGLGISGIANVKALNYLGAKIIVSDLKNENELAEIIEELKDINIEYRLGSNDSSLDGIDLILKSPGINPEIPILKKAIEKGIEIVTDLELSYIFGKSKHILAITGTNGKTTTTTLVGEIVKNSGKNSYVLGNIGVGMFDKFISCEEDDIFILECSSFQLEHTMTFRAEAAIITNITPDHLDWHGNIENYARAKENIYKNAKSTDLVVLNKDDMGTSEYINTKGRLIWFSKKPLDCDGVYANNGVIYAKEGLNEHEIMKVSDINILGDHNLENVLGAIAITYFYGINPIIIKDTISAFMGVEHRIEFVRELDGVKYYNDSKGTNVDSTIKALQAVEAPMILIAGGYDKNISFDELTKLFKNKVHLAILMGATATQIAESAKKNGFDDIIHVKDLEEAINKAHEASEAGVSVLLSPACASWGMFENYEERGREFKKIVLNLKGR